MQLRHSLLLVIVLVSLVALSCGSTPQRDLALPPGVDAYTGASPKPPKGGNKPSKPLAAADAGVRPVTDAGAKPAADAGAVPAADAGVP